MQLEAGVSLSRKNENMDSIRCSELKSALTIAFCLNEKEKELIGVVSMNGSESIVVSGSNDFLGVLYCQRFISTRRNHQ